MKNIKTEINNGAVAIFKSKDGPVLDVRLEKDTIWLSLDQMTELFNRDKSVISRHIKNVFIEGELKKKSVVANYATTAVDGKKYNVDYYNLDVIISVGYRVKSLRGTQFRIWATKTLKQHLIQGYTINHKRLLQVRNNLEDLQETILFLKEKSGNELLVGQEKEIINILANYSKTLTFLKKYDKDEFKLVGKSRGKFILDYKSARNLIDQVKNELLAKKETSEMFAQENGDKFRAILGNIYQTFANKDLYFSVEEKAAHLLYFVIKDHPFVDGNKRSASLLFVYFLDKNNCLYRDTGEKKISDNALATLALLIAVSDPGEKDKIIKMVTNLLSF